MWLTLVRRRRLITRLIEEHGEGLHAEASALFRANGLDPGDRLSDECALFIFWAVHVGIVNADTSDFDRWIAERLLDRRIRHMARACGSSGLEQVYRERRGQVLATTRNIFLYRGRPGDRPALPVTPASARLFVRHATAGRGTLPDPALSALLDRLQARLWACVEAMEPAPRAVFP